jgi:phytoene synthase
MTRRYIPVDWVGGATPADILSAAKAPGSGVHTDITAAVTRLLDMAEAFYASGAQGYRYLPWRAHLSIAVAARVYRQIGVQLRAADCAWHDGRQVTGKVTKLRCSVVALASLGSRFGAAERRHDQRLHLALRGLPYVV